MEQPHRAPSAFESFNARALEPIQVASSFIPPQQFEKLVLRSHALVVGPRGSGKTTLLKMLQPQAISNWNHPDAERLRSRVDFTGVFIGTDIGWSKQLQALSLSGLSTEHADLLVGAAFATRVFKSLVEAIDGRKNLGDSAFRSLVITPDAETLLATEVAESLRLRLRIPSLMGVRAALGDRLIGISGLASQERTLGVNGRRERLAAEPSLHLDLITGVSACLDKLELVAPQSRGEKWALLFDEMELAPRLVLRKLLDSFRSVDDRLLFKLSVSPFNEELASLQGALKAMAGQDFEEVVLTYANKEDSYRFCEQLFLALVRERIGTDETANEVLGITHFETPVSEWAGGNAYQADSRLVNQLASLAKVDASFAAYLEESGIDLGHLERIDSKKRAATLRKVAPLVPFRLAFRSTDEVAERTSRRVRARKTPDLYTGATALFAMVEGNPRWLIGIGVRLANRIDEKGSISRASQASEVGLAIGRFRALLRTMPVPQAPDDSAGRGLLKALDRLGDYIYRQVVVDDFTADPIGSFIVDANAPEWLLQTVGRALNAGALIYVPDDAAAPHIESLRGKRFRISYLLAPHYRIPIRLGRPLSITSALAAKSEVGVDVEQEPLFE